MLTIRKSAERGLTDLGWLHSRHTFSFGHYIDPAHMGFGPLRVINEDRVKPGAGFDSHGHRDMEIVSYVLAGALAHKDSLGGGSVLRPGEVQRMSAGAGIRHAEFNHSGTEPVRFVQIWIVPERQGVAPSYEQQPFADDDKRGRLRLVGSPQGREGSLTIGRDVDLYAGLFDAGEEARLDLRPGRSAWVQVTRGGVAVNGARLSAGDGAAITAADAVFVAGIQDGEVLVFDLAA